MPRVYRCRHSGHTHPPEMISILVIANSDVFRNVVSHGRWLFYALPSPPLQPGRSGQDQLCRRKHHTWELIWIAMLCQMNLQRIVLLFLYGMNWKGCCHQNHWQLHKQRCENGVCRENWTSTTTTLLSDTNSKMTVKNLTSSTNTPQCWYYCSLLSWGRKLLQR